MKLMNQTQLSHRAPRGAARSLVANYKDTGSSIFVEFPMPWRFLRPQLERAMPLAALEMRRAARVLAAPSPLPSPVFTLVSRHRASWHADRKAPTHK